MVKLMDIQTQASILTIDDNPEVLELTRAMLTEFGYQPRILTRPEFLFRLLENTSVDLILLDVNMPGIDGISILRQLKNDPLYRTIPVIMLTADTSDVLLAKCFENGVEDFITKPISPLILKARIHSVLTTRAYIQEIQNQKKKEQDFHLQLQDDLDHAFEVQQSILPKPLKVDFLESAVYYKALHDVSGDIYEMSVNEKGQANVFLGDGTGHGVSAAFVTMMCMMGLRNLDGDLETDDFIRKLNSNLSGSMPRGKFMTGIYLRINPDGTTSICNAGHPPLIHIPADGGPLQSPRPNGSGLCMLPSKLVRYNKSNLSLQPGDKLILFSDGLTEAENPQEEQFEEGALDHFLQKYRSLDVHDFMAQLLNELQTFSNGKEIQDDLTILGFQYR